MAGALSGDKLSFTKLELRDKFRYLRSENKYRLKQDSESIGNTIALLRLTTASVIHSYMPFEKANEVDPFCSVNTIKKQFPLVKVVYPRLTKKGFMEAVFPERTEFQTNRFGICEPKGGVIIDSVEVDLVLVPLLAADLRGQRVGYGGGFYDRFLTQCRKDCLKIGVSQFEPIGFISDSTRWDVRLNLLATPNKLYSF